MGNLLPMRTVRWLALFRRIASVLPPGRRRRRLLRLYEMLMRIVSRLALFGEFARRLPSIA